MTYTSLGVVVDVTTIMIIDMIRPMIRIPQHHLFCNIDLGNSSLYEHLAKNHRIFFKECTCIPHGYENKSRQNSKRDRLNIAWPLNRRIDL
jgi:hypothetical protein